MNGLRRLDPDSDHLLIIEALNWVNDYPRWARDADSAWGHIEDEDYLEMMRTDAQIDIGVFVDNEQVAMITVARVSKGIVNTHLLVKRGANPVEIIKAADALKYSLWTELHVTEIWAWLATPNKGVQRIIQSIGFTRDEIRMFKGKTHGKLITWERFSWKRELLALEQAA